MSRDTLPASHTYNCRGSRVESCSFAGLVPAAVAAAGYIVAATAAATAAAKPVSGQPGAPAQGHRRHRASGRTYGGSYNEQRFSPLKKINDANVKDLGLAWYADYDTNQNQHGSPLYVDGVIYVSTARNVVHAFDAKDGKRLWTYAPVA